jgi:hypothetical protein
LTRENKGKNLRWGAKGYMTDIPPRCGIRDDSVSWDGSGILNLPNIRDRWDGWDGLQDRQQVYRAKDFLYTLVVVNFK